MRRQRIKAAPPKPTARLPITIKLPWPPSANSLWRTAPGGHGIYLSREYKSYLNNATCEYLAQGRPRIEATPVQLGMKLFPPTRRPYDVDNRIKPTLDALTKIGFWLDDRIVRKITAVACPPVKNGAVIIMVAAFKDSDLSEELGLMGYYQLEPLD